MVFSTLVRLGDGNHVETSNVALACSLLEEGNVIALPTDTIYGLAASAQNFKAVEKLYNIKGRDSAKPLAICVGKVEDVSLWCKTDILPNGLLKSLLPGPVTVILERTPRLIKELNPSCLKVGIRIPDHPFIQKIAQNLNTPIALTSANKSNEKSPLSPEEFESLWPYLASVFDGGKLGIDQPLYRAGSTIVDLSTKGKYQIVRSGCALSQTLCILNKFDLKLFNAVVDDSSI